MAAGVLVSAAMSTLAEIEQATEALPAEEQALLFLRLGQRLRRTGRLPEPREYSAEQIAAWIKEDEEDGRKLRAELGLKP
jgi:hypothetical protein